MTPGRSILRAVAALLTTVLVAALSLAVPHAQRIAWAPGDERTNRFEGIIGRPVAGQEQASIELVSLVGQFETFGHDAQLSVTFYRPPGAVATVIGQELRRRRYYRMQSKPWPAREKPWDTFGPWPTRDVIDTEPPIPPDNIGVLVRVDGVKADGELFAPALVHSTATASSVAEYRVMLRPIGASLRRVDYQVDSIVDGKRVPHFHDSSPAEKTRGEAFKITIPTATLPEGQLRLTLKGYVKGSLTDVDQDFYFLHYRRPAQ